MRYLLIAACLLTGCATPHKRTREEALRIWQANKERQEIAAVERCGPEPTAQDGVKDLQFAKMVYSVCALNPPVDSLATGGPIGASVLVIDSR